MIIDRNMSIPSPMCAYTLQTLFLKYVFLALEADYFTFEHFQYQHHYLVSFRNPILFLTVFGVKNILTVYTGLDAFVKLF